MAGPRHQVMIVDDDPDFLDLIGLIMEQLAGGRWHVRTTTDPLAALELLDEEPVDLVLVDVCMPGMDGLQFIQQAHQRWPQLMLVAMSGDSTAGREQATRQRGAQSFIEKPRTGEGWAAVYAMLEERLRLAEESSAGV